MKFCKVSLTRMGHKKKHCRVDIVPFPGGSQGWGGVRSGVMQGMLCAELRGRSGNGFARKTSTGGQKAVALSGLLSKAKLVQAEVDTTMKPHGHVRTQCSQYSHNTQPSTHIPLGARNGAMAESNCGSLHSHPTSQLSHWWHFTPTLTALFGASQHRIPMRKDCFPLKHLLALRIIAECIENHHLGLLWSEGTEDGFNKALPCDPLLE